MIYPCVNCLVDVICRDICDDFKRFCRSLDVPIPDYLASTYNRFYRLRYTILKYSSYEKVVRIDANILKIYNRLYPKEKES